MIFYVAYRNEAHKIIVSRVLYLVFMSITLCHKTNNPNKFISFHSGVDACLIFCSFILLEKTKIWKSYFLWEAIFSYHSMVKSYRTLLLLSTTSFGYTVDGKWDHAHHSLHFFGVMEGIELEMLKWISSPFSKFVCKGKFIVTYNVCLTLFISCKQSSLCMTIRILLVEINSSKVAKLLLRVLVTPSRCSKIVWTTQL